LYFVGKLVIGALCLEHGYNLMAYSYHLLYSPEKVSYSYLPTSVLYKYECQTSDANYRWKQNTEVTEPFQTAALVLG
jgi:hypothetical protein